MDEKNRVKIYYNYFEEYKFNNIQKVLAGELDFVDLDFRELSQYNAEILNYIIKQPERELVLIKGSLKNFNSAIDTTELIPRITNTINIDKLTLSHIRSEHIGRLIKLTGMIKRKSQAMSKLLYNQYLCTNPNCSFSEDPIKVKQNQEQEIVIKKCSRCSSGVELIKEVNTDFIQISLEELSNELENSNIMPDSKSIELSGELTKPEFIEKFLVGGKVEVIGIIKEKIKNVNNKRNTLKSFYIEALNIISREENINELTISKREIEHFKSLAIQNDIKEILINSVAPNIAGREAIKLATLCYIVGGSKKNNQKDLIHILTVGNASLGKSQILKRLKKLLPRAVYVSGENASAVGLVGAAVKDEFTGGWTVDAGAMAHANNGYFLLDEFDKIRKDDQTKLNEALEHGECSITKAGIRATLKTYSPTYAVANPKYGKFDECKDYSSQLTFDKTLLSRFDLVFILDGKDNEKENNDIIDLILEDNKKETKTIGTEELRKYLIYAKSLNPKFSQDLKEIVKEYFIKIQNKSKTTNTIDITYRQLTGLIRLSEAITKLKLSDEVTKEDVLEAINLMNHTLSKFSISEVETGMSNKSRNILINIENVIEELENTNIKTNTDNIKSLLHERDIRITISELEINLEKLKRENEIFEPRKGIYKRLA